MNGMVWAGAATQQAVVTRRICRQRFTTFGPRRRVPKPLCIPTASFDASIMQNATVHKVLKEFERFEKFDGPGGKVLPLRLLSNPAVPLTISEGLW
jgi:hypothetical protein